MKRLCVFCGSSAGHDPAYATAAAQLGRVLAGRGIGTATDPYQPAERRYGLTRRILRALADTSGHKIFLTTKSDLVARDVELLQEVHARHWLHIGLTITTLDDGLARALEPRAPRPELRLEAMAGIIEQVGSAAMVSRR